MRYSLNLTEAKVYVYKSQFDGSEYLKIRTDIYYLETDKASKKSKYLFNGEVVGETSEIIARIKTIADVLDRNNYQMSF